MYPDENSLDRFLRAQKEVYALALEQLRWGKKQGHWMWYIFPQMRGLGQSSTAEYFGISDIEEAKAYLGDDVLGARLVECSQVILMLEQRSSFDIFGEPDRMKLRSCMTLFACVSQDGSVFHKVLSKYFSDEMDEYTLNLLSG